MNIARASRLRNILLITGFSVLIPLGATFAEDQPETFAPSLLSAPGQEDVASFNQRLLIVKKDMEVYREFAAHSAANGEAETLSQLQLPVDSYLKKQVDTLLEQSPESATLESTRLTAEVLFVKARLLMALKRNDDARTTIIDLKKRFAPYHKITIQAPDRMTTLDEAVKYLEMEFAKTTTPRKR